MISFNTKKAISMEITIIFNTANLIGKLYVIIFKEHLLKNTLISLWYWIKLTGIYEKLMAKFLLKIEFIEEIKNNLNNSVQFIATLQDYLNSLAIYINLLNYGEGSVKQSTENLIEQIENHLK